MGINPETLGESRVVSVRMHVMEQAKSGYGFTDRKAQWRPGMVRGRAKTTEDKIARLEHELAYTRQELEFVKKLYWRTGRRSGSGSRSKSGNQVRNHQGND